MLVLEEQQYVPQAGCLGVGAAHGGVPWPQDPEFVTTQPAVYAGGFSFLIILIGSRVLTGIYVLQA